MTKDELLSLIDEYTRRLPEDRLKILLRIVLRMQQ